MIHNDDFARPDLPGWDRDRFVRQVVQPLLAGRPARYQRWDFEADVGAEWHQVPVGVPVVVEGVSATDVRLPVPWDFTIWVEVPIAVRRRRIADRDGPALRRALGERLDPDGGGVRRRPAPLGSGRSRPRSRTRAPESLPLTRPPQGSVDPSEAARAD